MSEYSIRADVNRPYEEVVSAARAALASEGFGVLTEVDVKAVMKAKLGEEFRPYVILGACNPPSAFKVLTSEPDLGVFLPCNVVVYEATSDTSVIAAVNPMEMMSATDNPELAPVAENITARLERVVAAVAESA
jgi:uncharacterized protein (DUF302 family)